MKAFLSKLILVTVLTVFPSIPVVQWRLKSEAYKQGVGFEVYEAIDKASRVYPDVRAVIIGDSLAYQFFNHLEMEPEVVSLACNQAISMAGHVLLLEDFLKLNPGVIEIYCVFHPLSLSNNLDQKYTFPYFLKIFDSPEYRDRFTKEVKKALRCHPYRLLARIPAVKVSTWSPQYERPPCYAVAPITTEALTTLFTKAEIHDRALFFIPPPISEAKRDEVERMNDSKLPAGYTNQYAYYDESMCSDGFHFEKPDEARLCWQDSLPGVILTQVLGRLNE